MYIQCAVSTAHCTVYCTVHCIGTPYTIIILNVGILRSIRRKLIALYIVIKPISPLALHVNHNLNTSLCLPH